MLNHQSSNGKTLDFPTAQPAENGGLVKSESELQWERATEVLNRPLIVSDLNFSELNEEDDIDLLNQSICLPGRFL